MAFERTADRMREFVKDRMPSEVRFVEMFYESGCAFVDMKKAVSDGKGGCTIQEADPMRIVYNPVLDIKVPFPQQEVRVVQKRLMELNPGLKATCRACVDAAQKDPVAGNEYAWHTGNGYARSVVLKFPHFDTYCDTGVSPLARKVSRKRNQDKHQITVGKKQAVLPAANKVSPYFQNAQPRGCPANITADEDEMVARPPTPSLLHSAPEEVSVLPVKKDEAVGRRDPPRAGIQLLRTAATCAPLISYLKANNKMTPMGPAHWNAIKDWTKTEEGMDWLRMAQLDPLGVQLDHIVAQNGPASGYDSVFNCYFMPPSANSWFDSYDTKEKRDYIGKQAVEIARRFSKWMKLKIVKLARDNPELFDQSKFDPIIS